MEQNHQDTKLNREYIIAPSETSPMDKKSHPMIKTKIEYHLPGGSTKYFSNSPFLTIS